MEEEYNPFQSPAAPPTTPSYLVPNSLYGGPAGTPFASGHMRAMFAMSLLGMVGIAALLGCFACVSQINLLDALIHGPRPAQSALEANDQFMKSVVAGSTLANLATIVAFLMWTHRAYRNLPSLGARRLESTPGWAVGWYFVPFANLVMPCKLMGEIWRYSDPAQHGQLRKTTSGLVGIWWGAFLLRGFVSEFNIITAKTAGGRITAESLKANTSTTLVAFAVEFLAAVVGMLLVYRVDANQQATHDQIAAQGQSFPAMGQIV